MLGGDSIVSIQLVSKIRENLGYSISIKDIFKYKTIELLYDNIFLNLLNNQTNSSNFPIDEIGLLRFINSSENDHIRSFIKDKNSIQNILKKNFFSDPLSPFFFDPFVSFYDENVDLNHLIFVFPPGNGGAESYINNIVPCLKARRLIVFNNVINNIVNSILTELYLIDYNEILSKIDSTGICMFYIEIMKRIQPNGPYNFFGWCFGGMFAVKIAKILKDKFNDDVHNIFIIDAFMHIKDSTFEQHVSLEKNKFEYVMASVIVFENNPLDLQSNIILFKACNLTNINLKYIIDSEANNLEKLINPNKILIYKMENDDHDSWVKNKNQIEIICQKVLELTN